MGGIADSTGPFDYQGVLDAIEAERTRRGLTKTAALRDIAWLGQGVLDRMAAGKGTTCQHITGLLRWLGRSPESFMPGVTDRPEYALPDVGPFALCWSMPKLWQAVDWRREALGMTWDEAGAALGCPGVKDFGVKSTYGIPMALAMHVTRWLDQPANRFMYAAEPAPEKFKGSATWGAPPP